MPPSPAKHIKAILRRRKSTKKSSAEEGAPEEAAPELDKRFGFSKEVTSRLEVGEEVGRGHFGYTCTARYKKGEHKDQKVAVKVIPKSKVSDRDDSIIKISFLFRKKMDQFYVGPLRFVMSNNVRMNLFCVCQIWFLVLRIDRFCLC